MNNNIKEKIDELNEKISILEKNGFNMDEDKLAIENYYKMHTTFDNYPTMKLFSENDLSDIESKIENKYKRGKIFVDLDEIKSHLNYDISKEKLDKIDLVIINHLAFYLDGRNEFKSSKEDMLLEKLYNFIKFEYKIYYSSVVFDKLIGLNFGLGTISKLIKSDMEKYINEKDIYKRFNEYFDPDQIDKTMVYLISLNEDNYKKKIIDELESSRNEYIRLTKEYEDKKKSYKNSGNDEVYSQANGLKKTAKIVFGGILPRVLTIATLIGAIYNNFSKLDKAYHTTYKNYNEILGEYDSEDYATIKNNNVIIKLYTETNEEKVDRVFDVRENRETIKNDPKVTRTIYTFEVENDGRNIENYLDIDLSKVLPVSTIDNAYDENMNYLSKDEFKTVSIAENIDLDNYQYDASIGETIITNILTVLLIMLLDMGISYIVMTHNYKKHESLKWNDRYNNNWEYISGIFGPIFLDDTHSAMKAFHSDLDIIRTSIKKLEDDLADKKHDKDELKQLKKKIDIAKLEYQELLNRYSKLSELFEYNDYTIKLK